MNASPRARKAASSPAGTTRPARGGRKPSALSAEAIFGLILLCVVCFVAGAMLAGRGPETIPYQAVGVQAEVPENLLLEIDTVNRQLALAMSTMGEMELAMQAAAVDLNRCYREIDAMPVQQVRSAR